jgi:16S rRNA (uracil1498-N3)-methyltransferase
MSVTLSDDETRHLRDVLRLQIGDEIYVFDGAGREFHCAIGTIGKDSTQLKVIAEVEPPHPESPLHLTLAIALLKGEKFDLVVQKATELGVKRIVPLASERADVRLRDAEDTKRRVTRWQRIALEAAKQSGRATVPEVTTPLIFSSLPTLTDSRSATRLMFSEREGQSLLAGANLTEGQPEEIVALVGPEGGWTNEEIDLAGQHGWKIVTLGGRTLRAETAAIVVLSLLQHRFGDLV